MLYLIRNEMERKDLGNRARWSIKQNYSIDLIADRYIGLYQRMLEEDPKMCGICGEIDFNKGVATEPIQKMCRLMAHRGPDDEGILFVKEINISK